MKVSESTQSFKNKKAIKLQHVKSIMLKKKKISKIINNHIRSTMPSKCSARQGKQRQLSRRLNLPP